MTLDERLGLLRKYRQLARWRRAKDGGDPVEAAASSDLPPVVAPVVPPVVAGLEQGPEPATRQAMRTLADEFPGCLRELDVLGIREIDRRLRRLEALGQAAGEPPPEWMLWISGYHRLMRAALAARRQMTRTDRITGLSPSHTAQLKRVAATCAGDTFDIDEAFVHSVADPPGGRLSPLILGILARHFEVPAARIAATLFPPRRAPPYALD